MNTTELRARTGAPTIRRFVAIAALALAVAAAALSALPAEAGISDPAAGSTQRVLRYVFFHSPSGNINCSMNRRWAGCQIRHYSYTPPPKPKSCHFDWGQTLYVRKRAHFGCVSDAIPAGHVLRYGDSVRRGNKKCTSRRSGMICRNLHTGHGFRLSRDDVDRF